MTELIESLQKILGWTKSEASVYSALVSQGSMDAHDAAHHSEVPEQRIYNILSNLERKGAIKKQGKQPTIYQPAHPKKVIEQKREEFNDKVTETKAKLEEAYEVEAERYYSKDDPAWVVTSERGVVNELRSQIEVAEESLLFVDSRLGWMSPKNIEQLSELAEEVEDVKSVGGHLNREELRNLYASGVDVKYLQRSEIDNSYYILDGETVFMKIRGGKTGIVFTDEPMATIFIERFHSTYGQAKEVDTLEA